mmetsp:Transcript_21264/g.52375  ORF Transcript_21264/g.52375 Transcript_21264/m.52375 type:complete len:219 (+) Transcript_21264:891-1547(+)
MRSVISTGLVSNHGIVNSSGDVTFQSQGNGQIFRNKSRASGSSVLNLVVVLDPVQGLGTRIFGGKSGNFTGITIATVDSIGKVLQVFGIRVIGQSKVGTNTAGGRVIRLIQDKGQGKRNTNDETATGAAEQILVLGRLLGHLFVESSVVLLLLLLFLLLLSVLGIATAGRFLIAFFDWLVLAHGNVRGRNGWSGGEFGTPIKGSGRFGIGTTQLLSQL